MMGGGGQEAHDDFTTVTKAAQSFLSAVKSRDAEKIAAALAKHGQVEAVKDHQEVFKAAAEGTLDADQVDSFARAFGDMKFGYVGQVRGTGMCMVVVTKSNGKGGRVDRTLTMRHEAEGWKVQDFTGPRELKVIQPPKKKR